MKLLWVPVVSRRPLTFKFLRGTALLYGLVLRLTSDKPPAPLGTVYSTKETNSSLSSLGTFVMSWWVPNQLSSRKLVGVLGHWPYLCAKSGTIFNITQHCIVLYLSCVLWYAFLIFYSFLMLRFFEWVEKPATLRIDLSCDGIHNDFERDQRGQEALLIK